ncbi:hypothetical protein GCM10023081_02490 [Arthrobacter ginkgonis]|uniref:Uncharacterized protein n=1 Tax=Arthrobacter ginkgonis TaxID=1630594 RepID=A0ABP7BQ84_9MICC
MTHPSGVPAPLVAELAGGVALPAVVQRGTARSAANIDVGRIGLKADLEAEPAHPFSAPAMYSEPTPFPMEPGAPHAENRWGHVNMGYGLRKRPRHQDAVAFDDGELDYRGFPN